MKASITTTDIAVLAGAVVTVLTAVFCVLAWPVVGAPVVAGALLLMIMSWTVTLILGLTALRRRQSPWFEYTHVGLRRFFQASLLLSLTVLLVPLPLWYVGFVAASLLVSGLVLVWFSVASVPPTRLAPEQGSAPYGRLIMGGLLVCVGAFYAWNLAGYGFQMDELYGAREIKTFFTDGKLFYLEDTYYGRSEVTTLVGIASELVARALPIAIPLEVTLRLPMLLLSILSIWLVYRLLRRCTSELVAVGAAALVGLETYLVYFATYYRFYAIANFFLVVTLYALIRYPSRYVALLGSVLWAGGYFVLTEYCLFVSGFLLFWYLTRLWVERQKASRIEWFLAAAGLVLFPVAAAIILLGRQTAGTVYSLLALDFNPEAMMLMARWLFINYAPFLVVALLGAVGLLLQWWRGGDRALPPWTVLVVFVWASVFFLFFYIVHASFNFTFRVTLFFLPVLLVLFYWSGVKS